MTLWSSVADCWKDGDKMQFDAGVLESVFPADHDQLSLSNFGLKMFMSGFVVMPFA